MYKVLLVDDEVLIREAVRDNVHWSELGFRLIGTCRNGKEAVEAIQETPPDLLLTDIRMPHMDGIALTRFVYENYPGIKVVIISGYDEFEYAKQAIRYKVIEYILKPISAYELSDTLTKIRQNLDYENQWLTNMKKIRGAYYNSRQILKREFLNRLLLGQIINEGIEQKMKEMDICLCGKYFTVILIEARDDTVFSRSSFQDNRDLALFAILNVSEEVMGQSGNGVVFQDKASRTVVILGADGPRELDFKSLEICRRLNQNIEAFLKLDVVFGVGEFAEVITALGKAFQSAGDVLEYRFLSKQKEIYFARDFRNVRGEKSIDMKEWIARITLAVKKNDEGCLIGELSAFIRDLQSSCVSKKVCTINVQNMMVSLMNLMDEIQVKDSGIRYEMKRLQVAIYEDENLECVERHLREACIKTGKALALEKDGYYQRQVMLAHDYIDKHYQNADISLNSICGYLAVSVSHFSYLFKHYTGDTFIEALTKKRIEKAKGMMENTSMKIYEISEAVGYENPQYFSSIFKKYTGKTPREYMRMVR